MSAAGEFGHYFSRIIHSNIAHLYMHKGVLTAARQMCRSGGLTPRARSVFAQIHAFMRDKEICSGNSKYRALELNSARWHHRHAFNFGVRGRLRETAEVLIALMR